MNTKPQCKCACPNLTYDTTMTQSTLMVDSRITIAEPATSSDRQRGRNKGGIWRGAGLTCEKPIKRFVFNDLAATAPSAMRCRMPSPVRGSGEWRGSPNLMMHGSCLSDPYIDPYSRILRNKFDLTSEAISRRAEAIQSQRVQSWCSSTP